MKRYVKTRVTEEMDRTLQIVQYLVGGTQKILISLTKTQYFLDKIDENTFINWYNTRLFDTHYTLLGFIIMQGLALAKVICLSHYKVTPFSMYSNLI